MSLHGPHGQWIENIHLDPYTTEEEFHRELYEKKYSGLLKKAHEFIEATGGTAKEDVLVFIRYVIIVVSDPLPYSRSRLVVDSMRANTNTSRCQDTNAKFLYHSTIVSHKTHANLQMRLQMEGLSAFSKADTATVL